MLASGEVLVAGGELGPPTYAADATAELYDLVTQSWIATGAMNEGRANYSASIWPSGEVLVQRVMQRSAPAA